MNILGKLVVDRLYFIGIFLLQLKPLLIGFALDLLDVRNVLRLGLADLLFQTVNLAIHFLSLSCPFGVATLNPFVSGEFIRKSHAVIILLFLNPVQGLLIRSACQLVPQTVHLAVSLLPFFAPFQISFLNLFVSGQFFLQTEPVVILLFFNPVQRCLIGSAFQLIPQAVHLTVSFLPFFASFQISCLNALIGGKFFLQTEPVVILLFLNPVHGCLVCCRHKFILKPVDLTVDFLPLLASGLVLLLKLFISGQFVLQTELSVILLLFRPFLECFDSLGTHLEYLTDHTGRSLRRGNDAVLHTDCQTFSDVLTQMDEFS